MPRTINSSIKVKAERVGLSFMAYLVPGTKNGIGKREWRLFLNSSDNNISSNLSRENIA
jgi:hypothetical protein